MYTRADARSVEDVCYENYHIQAVVDEIKKGFDRYFTRFIETKGGASVSLEKFKQLQQHFGVQGTDRGFKKNSSEDYKHIIRNAVEEFESDRQDYLNIFVVDTLEEYEEDPGTFKSTVLKNKCPIIRKTLQNRLAKELDKYRYSFSIADADELLSVVRNLCDFAEWYEYHYDAASYERASSYKDLNMSLLDTDEYTAYGVIGGGIKSMMLYKVDPKCFPSRSQNAIWALWYLTDKKDFGCKMASEFLMIDVKKCITQQNYFYPYQLFAFYAFEIYKLLRDKANAMGAYIDPDYRYVIVDEFLNYVANTHRDEIDTLARQIKEGGGFSYA